MHVLPQRMNHTDQRVLETGGLAFAVAIVLTAIGTYAVDGESNDTSIVGFLAFVAVLAAVTVAVYALAVRRAESHEDAKSRMRASSILAVCGVLSVAVFWTGLPTVLAAASILLAYDARRAGATGSGPIAAIAVSCAVIAGAVVLAFTG
jgi:amino acid transporter